MLRWLLVSVAVLSLAVGLVPAAHAVDMGVITGGEKGTYYRAMVGPFSTREQAVQLCGSLKAAGGDCVVQH